MVGIIGGYQVVRRLGAGERSEVWLGRAVMPISTVESSLREASTGGELAAIKVYREDVAPSTVDRELTALTRVNSPHIVGVIDAAAEGDRQCVVLRLLDPGGLTRLLASRATLTRGELVTLLVPLARAVTGMHSAGVSHGSLRASKVLFAEDGAPVLLGGANMASAPHPPSRSALREGSDFIRDRRALWSLASDVIARSSDPADVTPLTDWLRAEPWSAPGFPDELSERVFATGPPEPLSIPWLGLDAATDVGRSVSSAPVRPQNSAQALEVDAPPWRHALKRISDAVRSAIKRMRDAYASVRPRFRLLGLAGIVLIAGVLFFATTTADVGDPSSEGHALENAAPAAAPGMEADLPAAESELDTAAGPEAPALDREVLMGDDPVPAATLLLSMRDSCFSAASAQCLEGVLQRDSAAWMADMAALTEPRALGDPHTPFFHEGSDVSVVDIMGGVVLLSIDGAVVQPKPDSANAAAAQRGPASVLIIRTEAGWRIRDVLEG